ncbi:MAG: VCBS repeat-containing protein, partial [Armatimonadetes bacterium]|nr:VCBS repeat-containing protein [Armatimonadota bacterium]
MLLYENMGDGRFERNILDTGIGTHHARLADLYGRGTLDIVSRPLHGPDRWKVFAWVRHA